MIDTEHVKCDTCTAPEPMELDASDEASRGWPTVDIETNPYKAQFPLFQQHPEIAFLDSAATAQRPACVLDAERDFYQRMNANPLRGLYSLSVEATDAIAKVRQQIADLIGASQANEVVFTRNTSESLNLVAKSFAPTVLEPGDEVVITIMEHHSNLIPWQQVCRETGAKLVYLYPTKTGQLTTEEVLSKVGPKTKILAVGQVSNVLGVENPVKNLGKLVHKYGGYLVYKAICDVMMKEYPDAAARALSEFDISYELKDGGSLVHYLGADKTVIRENAVVLSPKFSLNVGVGGATGINISEVTKYEEGSVEMYTGTEEKNTTERVIFGTGRTNLPSALIYRDDSVLPFYDILAERFNNVMFAASGDFTINMADAERYSGGTKSLVDYVIIIVSESNVDKTFG